MYGALETCRGELVGCSAGFIHVPFLPEQAKNGEPSMALEDIVAALDAALSVVARHVAEKEGV